MLYRSQGVAVVFTKLELSEMPAGKSGILRRLEVLAQLVQELLYVGR